MNDSAQEARKSAQGKLTRRERARKKREADEDDIEHAIEELKLEPSARQYVTLRVLPYARFCENQANSSRLTYYWLRIPAIVLAAIVPALVAANLGAATRWIATILGIVVAATAATEHFLNVGARWRHYRSTAESIKSETWKYLELDSAAKPLAERIENLIKEDWSAYIGIIDTERPHDQQQQTTEVVGKTDPTITGQGSPEAPA
jgi:Protein of unknown function (DUF4231)